MKPQTDVLIVGAGAAGLMAARALVAAGKTCVVVEARERAGGRIYTVNHPGFDLPIDLGAEFIHGDLPLTKRLLTEADIGWFATEGDVWKTKNGAWTRDADFSGEFTGLETAFAALEEDIPVGTFLEKHVFNPGQQAAIKRYTEGYNAASVTTASTFALRATLAEQDSEQSRVQGGYSGLINFLLDDLKHQGARVHFSSPIDAVYWQEGFVEATGNGIKWTAEKIIITVPLGVLQHKKISFHPGIPSIENAIQSLGFGNVVKVVLQFDTPFWTDKNHTSGRDLRQLHFLLSQEIFPTWWTPFPFHSALLTGWLAGPDANRFLSSSNEEILEVALASLAALFDRPGKGLLDQLVGWQVANWGGDPYSFGGYSFSTVGEWPHKELIRNGVANTVFFAGEGLVDGMEMGTVEAALRSGTETAHRLLQDY